MFCNFDKLYLEKIITGGQHPQSDIWRNFLVQHSLNRKGKTVSLSRIFALIYSILKFRAETHFSYSTQKVKFPHKNQQCTLLGEFYNLHTSSRNMKFVGKFRKLWPQGDSLDDKSVLRNTSSRQIKSGKEEPQYIFNIQIVWTVDMQIKIKKLFYFFWQSYICKCSRSDPFSPCGLKSYPTMGC